MDIVSQVGLPMTDNYIQLEHSIDESGFGHPGGSQSIPVLFFVTASAIFLISRLFLKSIWLDTLMGRLVNDLYAKQWK